MTKHLERRGMLTAIAMAVLLVIAIAMTLIYP